MKISTKGRYALRLMTYIAQNGKDRNVSLKEIATKEDISVKYLEQIIGILNHANFVKSERGTNGGYKLTKNANEYTIGMILRLTETNLYPAPCCSDDCDCTRIKNCPSSFVFKKINEAINGVIDSITLEDLINETNN